MPKTKKKPSKRKPNPAFMRPVQPDEKLSAIVGSQPLPRSELTKKLWNYIKKHGCQDKKKRTMINADDSLRPVFNGKSQVSMFEMTKLCLILLVASALLFLVPPCARAGAGWLSDYKTAQQADKAGNKFLLIDF